MWSAPQDTLIGMEVYLVDGTYELFRHFYAVPSAREADGREVGAVRGVLASVLGMINGGAKHVGVATDHVIESFRNSLWPGYKTGEGIDPDLFAQFPLLEEGLEALGVTTWPMVEFEADDALAAAAAIAAKDPRVTRVLICTPDKDLAQCVVGTRVVQLDRRTRQSATKPASSRSSACGRNRFRIIWRWSATTPTASLDSRAGARSPRRPCSRSSDISNRSPRTGGRGV